MTGEKDMDTVADAALLVAIRVREEDPTRVFNHLLGLCEQHPVKAAQVLMALAAWMDPDTPTNVLFRRVEDITKTRVAS